MTFTISFRTNGKQCPKHNQPIALRDACFDGVPIEANGKQVGTSDNVPVYIQYCIFCLLFDRSTLPGKPVPRKYWKDWNLPEIDSEEENGSDRNWLDEFLSEEE